MWLVHTLTGEEGWHICQENQRHPCRVLVFLKEGGAWKTSLWNSQDTRIRASTYSEERRDALAMRESGFLLGSLPARSNRNV